MPSYIELNKNASVPASSDPNKVILSVDTSGQVTTTDSTGQTSPVGGGGTGLYIPQPIPYRTFAAHPLHGYNQALSELGDGSGIPGAIQNSWSGDNLKLTYQTSDYTFLNYNPKYFLFVYQGTRRYGNPKQPSNPARLNNNKYGKYFSHPGNYTSGGQTTASYSNFSAASFENVFTGSLQDFTTEWAVASGSGNPTALIGFNPLRFYACYTAADGSWVNGREFFPLKITGSFDGTADMVSVRTKKGYKKYVQPKTTPPSPVATYTKSRVNLYIKFAIVIDDPNNAGRYLIGPMSDTIRIFPREGYFEDDIDTGNTFKYYFAWNWKLV